MPLFAGVQPAGMYLWLNPCFNSMLSCCKVGTELRVRRDQRSNLDLGLGELIKLLAHMTEFEGIVPLHYRDRLMNISQFCRNKPIQVAKCNIPANIIFE